MKTGAHAMELTTLHVEILEAALHGGIWGLGTEQFRRRSRAHQAAVAELVAAGFLEPATVTLTCHYAVIRLTKNSGKPLAQEQWDHGASERAFQAARWTAKLKGSG